MKVTPAAASSNSAKFNVTVKRGEFIVALSYTLRTRIWQLADSAAELDAAKELAEAIVSRHEPSLPFKPLYIFAEHNTAPSLADTVHTIRKYGYDKMKT